MPDKPTADATHGLSVQHADALWDAVAIPGPTEPTFPMQHERVCRAVAEILAELTPAQPAVPASSPPPDQTALRDRIAEALYERERPPRDPHWPKAFAADREVFEPMAAAVLAVLPPPADRAAICRGLADQQTQLAVADDLARRRDMAAARRQLVKELRRLAAEAQQPATDTEHTPEPAQEA